MSKAYDGNADGKPIYDHEIDHGYGQPLAGGTDVMRRLQNQYLREQGRPERPSNPQIPKAARVASRYLEAGSPPPGRGGYSVWIESLYDPAEGKEEIEQEKLRFRSLRDMVKHLHDKEGVFTYSRMVYKDPVRGWRIPGWEASSTQSGYSPIHGDFDGDSQLLKIGVLRNDRQPLTPEEIAYVERELKKLRP